MGSGKVYKNINGQEVELTDEELQEHYQNQPTEEYQLEVAKQARISLLEQYFHSPEVTNIKININNAEHKIINNAKTRDLFLTKLEVLQNQIASGLITEAEANFSFQNDGEVIDMNLPQIKQTLFFLDQKRRSQFYNKEAHKISILSLAQKESIENYNFATGW